MGPTQGSAARATVLKTAIWVSSVSAAVVILGGTAAWLLERHVPGRSFRSSGDTLWWALTTVGYGDHAPVTTAGRLVAAVVMIAGVAVLGGVAAGVALIVARAVAVAEEQSLDVEAESLERRLEERPQWARGATGSDRGQLQSLERTHAQTILATQSKRRGTAQR